MARKAADNEHQRMLHVLGDEIATLVAAAERIRSMFDVLAERHDLEIVEKRVSVHVSD